MLQIITELNFSKDQYESISDMAACNFSAKQMALVLEVNQELFKKMLNTEDSSVWEAYHRGILSAQLEVDKYLLDNAKTGNFTAAQEYKKSSRARAFENIKNNILNGG